MLLTYYYIAVELSRKQGLGHAKKRLQKSIPRKGIMMKEICEYPLCYNLMTQLIFKIFFLQIIGF